MVSTMKHRNEKQIERDFLVTKLLMEHDSIRFKDIWDKVKISPLFKSKRELWDTLDFLVKDKRSVKRCIISHKRVVYVLAGDFEILEKLRLEIKWRDDFFPKVQDRIKASKDDPDINRVTDFYIAFMLKELSNYLGALSVWVDVDKKWKDVVRFLILNYDVRYLAILLNDCRNANPEAFENAVRVISETLSKMSSEVWPTAPSETLK